MKWKLPNIPTEYLSKAFSDNGTPSSSRLLGAFSTLAAVFCLVYVTIKNHIVPDALTTGGLAGFGTAHYAVNRVSNMFGGQKKDQDGGNADTSEAVKKGA